MFTAIAATISHWLVIFALIDVATSAVTASRLALPALVLKINSRTFLIWELGEKFKSADRFGLFAYHEL